jgi:para-nitrobenzyl esterase
MCNYWCNFIKSGDPNGKDADGTDLPYWSPYTEETPYGMVFSSEGACPEKKEETPFMKFLIDRNTEEIKNTII